MFAYKNVQVFEFVYIFICSPISYELYDIYNNGFNRGGKLNITFDRYFIVNEMGYGSLTESIIQRRTKYENRSNMSDITVQVAVIVSCTIEIRWVSDCCLALNFFLSNRYSQLNYHGRPHKMT